MPHVDVRRASDVVIVDFEGRLLAGPGEELLRGVVNELLGEGWKKILLNLSKVGRIDSAGIGELVAGVRLAQELGTRVRVVQPSGRVYEVLNLSRVLPLLDIYADERSALDGFRDPHAAAPTPTPVDDGDPVDDDATDPRMTVEPAAG